jgi:hypothetical protein
VRKEVGPARRLTEEIDAEVRRRDRRCAGCVVVVSDARDKGTEEDVIVHAPSEFCFRVCSRQSR